jgi:hypothetical protein
MAEKFIQKAIKHPGAFREQAERAGMDTASYARKVLAPGSRAPETTKRRARLALTLMKLAKRR